MRGSKAKSVSKLGLHRLPSYGELARFKEAEVLAALDQLLAEGRLERRGRKYPKLWVAGRTAAARSRSKRSSSSSTRPKRSELARELENYRRRTARRLNWKPYMVFHRKVITAVDRQRPQTLEELERIPGLGPAKVERFGEDILALMRQIDG